RGAGPERRDQAVRGLGEREEALALRSVPQIEDDAALAAVPHEGARAIALGIAARRLDADDLRPVLREHHPGPRAGHPPAELEDPHAAERLGLRQWPGPSDPG